jgi:hypothetical protein
MNDIVPVFAADSRDIIESAVIEGATHFLQAKSYSDLLLLEYEKSGKQEIDYSAVLGYAEKAIVELEKAKEAYLESLESATRAGYVNDALLKFKVFDYSAFQSEKGLNNDLMSTVKSHLSTGDVLGVYRENVDNIAAILSTLQFIKGKIEMDAAPDISLYWQLLQRFSYAALYGNYCTMTAAEVLR